MKIHSPDFEADAEKFSASPHVYKAINTRTLSLCGIITENMDSHLYPVTCKHCLQIITGELPNRHIPHVSEMSVFK